RSPGPFTGSPVDQAPLPLVDQEVGDDGRAWRPGPAAGVMIAGRQVLQVGPPLRGGEEGSEFVLPLPEGLRRLHRPVSGGAAGSGVPGSGGANCILSGGGGRAQGSSPAAPA